MGKKDAFGNEIGGEDSLEAMGWKVGQAPIPPPVVGDPPAPAPVTAAPTPLATMGASVPPAPTMPSLPTTPRLSPTMPASLPSMPGSPGFNGGRVIARLVALFVFLGIAGGVVAAVLSAVNTADHVKHSFSLPNFTPPSTSTPSTPSQPAKPSQPPVGLKQGSLVRADAFAPALVKLRRQGTRAQTMRVDPTRISANVIGADNALRIASITWDGSVQTIKTPTHLTGVQTVSLKSIDSKAPSRALARAAGLLGRPARTFNYMVLMSFAGTTEWVVYFKDGKYVRASADGRHVQRVN